MSRALLGCAAVRVEEAASVSPSQDSGRTEAQPWRQAGLVRQRGPPRINFMNACE